MSIALQKFKNLEKSKLTLFYIIVGIVGLFASILTIDALAPEFFDKYFSEIQNGSQEKTKIIRKSMRDGFIATSKTNMGDKETSSLKSNYVLSSEFNFQFSKANEKNWLLIPSVQLTLLRNPQILQNEIKVFELKHKDFVQSREKRIEIIIFEPNDFSVKDNIQWLVTLYHIGQAETLVPNFKSGLFDSDIFYESKCKPVFEKIDLKCKRRGLIDVFKDNDRLFVIHTWVDRNEYDNRHPMVSSDVIDVMKSFEIINK